MSLTGKYIYCFIMEKEKLTICSSCFGKVISPVYTIPYQELSAVVSNSEVCEYDPTRKNVQNHRKVITKVMENYTIIPVAFGTVGNDSKEIEKIISDNYENLKERLGYLKDKAEVGLKITWDENYFYQDIENKEIAALKEKVNGKDEEEVLLDKIQLGRLVQEMIEKKKDEYIEQIYTPLSKAAVDSKRKDGIPIKTVFNAYFLVSNSESDKFDRMVEELYQCHRDKLVFHYTGPWPPYNFVELRLKVNEENRIKK